MPQYLIFDIETAPRNFNELSDSQQEYLIRYAKTPEEEEQKKFEMGLYPLTAHVVTIGLILMEGDGEDYNMVNTAAFSSSSRIDDDESIKITEKLDSGFMHYITSEKKLLETFWSIIKKYPEATLISFNGRNFDAPFLMLRSALLEIRPTRNIMQGTKFNYSQHIDLIDELTFFSPSSYGATKRFNFDFYAREFGITSPKSEGVDGSMVGNLYKNGQIRTIAEYCLRDVKATWELFLKWQKYLKF